jgi:hypothetical protein
MNVTIDNYRFYDFNAHIDEFERIWKDPITQYILKHQLTIFGYLRYNKFIPNKIDHLSTNDGYDMHLQAYIEQQTEYQAWNAMMQTCPICKKLGEEDNGMCKACSKSEIQMSKVLTAKYYKTYPIRKYILGGGNSAIIPVLYHIAQQLDPNAHWILVSSKKHSTIYSPTRDLVFDLLYWYYDTQHNNVHCSPVDAMKAAFQL